MAISNWPQQERPREKLIERGPSSLSDAELLAIFLRTGVQGESAVDVARRLLNNFGSLRSLIEADLPAFCEQRGMGMAKYVQLQACIEMTRRYLISKCNKGTAISDPKGVVDYLSLTLRAQPNEVFAAIFLDNQHQIIEYKELFYGTINGAQVYPRVVVQQALKYNAAAIIFAHNHPSGICEPSQSDIQITDRLKNALALVDIRVLDHFIVGDTEHYSFAQHGLI